MFWLIFILRFFTRDNTEYNVELYPHKSLIVFDEVQKFPKSRQSIKKLVKDDRYNYIETVDCKAHS